MRKFTRQPLLIGCLVAGLLLGLGAGALYRYGRFPFAANDDLPRELAHVPFPPDARQVR